jgi:hypothetical protein
MWLWSPKPRMAVLAKASSKLLFCCGVKVHSQEQQEFIRFGKFFWRFCWCILPSMLPEKMEELRDTRLSSVARRGRMLDFGVQMSQLLRLYEPSTQLRKEKQNVGETASWEQGTCALAGKYLFPNIIVSVLFSRFCVCNILVYGFFTVTYIHRQRSWLRHYAASRRAAGSSPEEVSFFFFNLPNPSSRTMAMVTTQPLTKMSTRNFPGGKGRSVRKADLTEFCEPTVWRKCGSLDVSQPYGPSQPCVHSLTSPVSMRCFGQHCDHHQVLSWYCRCSFTVGIYNVSLCFVEWSVSEKLKLRV